MTYYYNEVTVRFLSGEPWDTNNAEDIRVLNYEITEGGSIGQIEHTVINREMTRDEAVEKEIEFDGDGTFLVRDERAVRCVCGYGPTDEEDLDQHILASMHLPGDHAESR